jgi:CRISPR-associated exonuclease Cas4
MAGRIVMLLAAGADPRSIAAITFTELAASQLDARVHRYINSLLVGSIPETLQLALPEGRLTAQQRLALQSAFLRLDQVTMVTIHSFCQTVISSYAVEADIDPGARMLDGDQAGTFFDTVFDSWINERFSRVSRPDDPISALAQDDPRRVVDRLRQFAGFRLRHREARTLGDQEAGRPDVELDDAVASFRRWMSGLARAPHKVWRLLEDLEKLAAFFHGSFASKPDFGRLWRLAHDAPVVECMGYQPEWRQRELFWPKQKSDWEMVSRTEGAGLHDQAHAYFDEVDASYRKIMGRVATAIIGRLAGDLDEVINSYDKAKRAAAVLDFDDLLIKARSLVRNNELVRKELGARYKYLFVDEFQDTDQIQAEVIFSIGAGARGDEWHQNEIRAGSLFLVGDPKQSIYRFRGADLACYRKARAAIAAAWPGNVLKITENFRSRVEILNFVNNRFASVFRDADLEYEDLTSTSSPPTHGFPTVSKLVFSVGSMRADDIRNAEAEAVADLCHRLIGNIDIKDGDHARPLAAGDITLLSPGWTDLWRYERALEAKGLPIATQAGKGFFSRQEVQDLLSLARTLADSRDYLAFGALMRGPLVGLTDQGLLDVVKDLKPRTDDVDGIPRFSLMTNLDEVSAHPLVQEILTILKSLQRKARITTPGLLLTEAVERLNVRAILSARDPNDSGRALANLERFLERARGYRVRGLENFVKDVTREWSRKNNAQVEGQIDTDGTAINLITIHSAKGLEWPVIIPINACTAFGPRPRLLHLASDDTLHWVIDDVAPPTIIDARAKVESESQRERERMWYVTCTRAGEFLILPELQRLNRPTWSGVIDLRVGQLPRFPVETLVPAIQGTIREAENQQTADIFESEFAEIAARSMEIVWIQPSSRDDDRAEEIEALLLAPLETPDLIMPIGGGRVRGLVLHKLIEEVLTDEVQEGKEAIVARAQILLRQLESETEPGAISPDPVELAETVLRTLRLPEIVRLRPTLLPEYAVYATSDPWTAIAGRIDAIASNAEGLVVVDWKSDTAPSQADIQDHLMQIKDYARVVSARQGLLVYMTSGNVYRVDCNADLY